MSFLFHDIVMWDHITNYFLELKYYLPWKSYRETTLTHFRTMFHLRINQVVGFY